MAEEPRAVTDEETPGRGSHDDLLLQAVAILRTRHRNGGWYDLSPDAGETLIETLSEIAVAHDVDGVDRKEAIALAHRVLDDDHPQASPLWPRSGG